MQLESDHVIDDKYRKSIEKYLAIKNRASINQISSDLDISWATAKKHLDHLEAIGRVHSEKLGNSIIYFFNGKGEWQDKVMLTDNHILFLDTFVSSFGEPFIRIKEAKREGNRWTNVGDVMITKNKIDDVIGFLKKVSMNIEKYRGGGKNDNKKESTENC
jgi:DNA-binding transcriptional ArsR family regulator